MAMAMAMAMAMHFLDLPLPRVQHRTQHHTMLYPCAVLRFVSSRHRFVS